ncbi:MAG: GNAT family N-acetyltransferase [Gemmataceae bacterium]
MLFQDVQQAPAYFKRFRMEIDLQDGVPPAPPLPEGYAWAPWSDDICDEHGETKYLAFQDEIDSYLFLSFASRDGCLNLMRDIANKIGFLPGATWLIRHGSLGVATIQGVRDRAGMGSIQNVGVLPGHRGKGLGTALLLQALHGFRQASCHKSHLEVTAQNQSAIRLYHRLGFRRRKTIYKMMDNFQSVII